jgi:hypothetical protein
MKKHITQIVVVTSVMLVVFASTLGVLAVLELLTVDQLKEYVTKLGIVALLIMSASFVIATATSLGKTRE